MGVSTEQWRAAIGRFVGRSAALLTRHPAESWINVPDADPAWSHEDHHHPPSLTLSGKACALGLLLMTISAICHGDLLLMSGVESNPGPPKRQPLDPAVKEARENILAGLCAKATDTGVRDILQLYKVDMTTGELKSTFTNKARKDPLVKVMAYLGVPGMDSYKKDAIVENLIAKVQGLFQDEGQVCHTTRAPEERVVLDPAVKEARENVLAGLCAKATDTEVRDILRLYKVEMTTGELKSTFKNKARKDPLVKVLAYLGVPGMESYKKDAVVDNLITKVQGLFPDECQVCKTSYVLEHGEKPLLECVFCGQGAHSLCIAQLCGFVEADLQTLTAETIQDAINPCKIPGQPWVCGACYPKHIPSKDAGKRKDEKKKEAAAAVLAMSGAMPPIPEADEEVVAEEVGIPPPNAAGVDAVNAEIRPPRVHRKSGDTHIKPGGADKPICRHYKKGNCRFGRVGKDCPNSHPRPCRRLLSHGTHPTRGCTKGDTCEQFHPVMCESSLKGKCSQADCKKPHVRGTRNSSITTQGEQKQQNVGRRQCQDSVSKKECMNAKCKKEHLPGTKRTNTKRDLAETPTPGDKGDGSSAVAASAAQNNSQVDFLGLLQAMKSEIMGAIDEKLKSHPTPVYQTTKMPPQFLNNYQSAVPQIMMMSAQPVEPTGA